MPRSTKKTITIALGNTNEERDRRMKSLRMIAEIAEITGRYGGNVSEMFVAIADLEERDREALAIVLKKFLGRG